MCFWARTPIMVISDFYHIFGFCQFVDLKKMGQEKTETYEAIFEACEEGILLVDKRGGIVIANRACHTLFGYEPKEMIGMQVEALVPPPLRKSHAVDRGKYEENPSPRQMGKGRDLSGRKKNGDQFSVEISLNQVQIHGVHHTIAFVIDITERKKIEEALKKSEEQLIIYATELEKRVTQRTRDLDRTIKELEKANTKLEEQVDIRKKAEEDAKVALNRERELNELKSRFVSMASHEFRTPLSTILSSASLIERYEGPGTEDKRKKHLDKIKTSIGNLTDILNDFLSLSRLEEGEVPMHLERIEVVSMLKAVRDEMMSIAKKGQQIKIVAQNPACHLYTDKKILTNTVINLLSNAIKYSEPNTTATVSLEETDDIIKLQFSDEGMGIPEGEQKHLFERFFRASNAVNIQGTGLGLNIVKRYVDILQGRIYFESKPNEGTTFTIHLPK